MYQLFLNSSKVYFISVLYALAQLQFTAELATLYYLLGTVLPS